MLVAICPYVTYGQYGQSWSAYVTQGNLWAIWAIVDQLAA
jgi:hypothetical protein